MKEGRGGGIKRWCEAEWFPASGRRSHVTHHQETVVDPSNKLFMASLASLGPGTNTFSHSSPPPSLSFSCHLCNTSGVEGFSAPVCAVNGDGVEAEPV